MHDVRVKTSSGWIARVRVLKSTIRVYREGLTPDGAGVDELVLTWPTRNLRKDFHLIVEGLKVSSVDVTKRPLSLLPRPDSRVKSQSEAAEERRESRSRWDYFRRAADRREAELNGE